MTKRTRLGLEELERRTLPATFGIPWPNPAHLTLSFVPDGTQVGNQQSQLFKTLDAVAPTQVWQAALVRAFQTWAVSTNINLSVVPDSGAPLGTTGPLQSDPRFGDIRVTAVPLPPDVVGVSTPFDPTAGSWAGDVELNSNYVFGAGNGAGTYDLFSVALHEAGHALGIEGSDDPASPMYDQFNGTRTALTPGDVAAIQGLYGARTPDVFDASSPNNSPSKGTALNLSLGGNGLQPLVIDANIGTPGDLDFYQIKPGSNQTGMTVLIRTSGTSLLVPRLTVYSPGQSVITSVAAADPLQGDLSVHLSNLVAGATYYLEVAPATSDVFSTGSYRLQVVPDGATPASGGAAAGVMVLPDDAHTNDTLGTATDLRQSAFQGDARYAYACQAAITDGTDADFYHIRTPQNSGGSTTPVVMRVLVWGTTPGGLDPAVSVFDARGNLANAQVLVNENGSCVVQIPDAVPNTDYYVAVRGERSDPLHGTGAYFLGVNFGTKVVGLQAFTGGTLTQGSPPDLRTLQVDQSQLFHLVLAVNSGQVPGTSVTMTVFDQAGNVVARLTALGGEAQSTTLFLTPGAYTVSFAAATADGSPLAPTTYSLSGLALSDPIGPITTNPTLSPTPAPAPGSTSTLGYYWLQYGYLSWLTAK